MAQDMLRIPRGTIRGTCLIETLLAAFEMDEFIFELKEHSSGRCSGILGVVGAPGGGGMLLVKVQTDRLGV